MNHLVPTEREHARAREIACSMPSNTLCSDAVCIAAPSVRLESLHLPFVAASSSGLGRQWRGRGQERKQPGLCGRNTWRRRTPQAAKGGADPRRSTTRQLILTYAVMATEVVSLHMVSIVFSITLQHCFFVVPPVPPPVPSPAPVPALQSSSDSQGVVPTAWISAGIRKKQAKTSYLRV